MTWRWRRRWDGDWDGDGDGEGDGDGDGDGTTEAEENFGACAIGVGGTRFILRLGVDAVDDIDEERDSVKGEAEPS